MTPRHQEPILPGHTKILIPVDKTASKGLITRALHLLVAFKHPQIILFHVIEIPSRASTLDLDPYRNEINRAEENLTQLSKWLTEQGLEASIKVAIARNAAEGIVTETEMDGYMIVFLMKRRSAKGWRRIFNRSVSERVVREANCLVLTAPLGNTANSKTSKR
jgi:nucleotide-binding universal stress UspA family protein